MAEHETSSPAAVLDPAGAFVLRLRRDARRGGPVAGTIEHVSSGRRRRFDRLEDMTAFVLDVLSEGPADGAGPEGAGGSRDSSPTQSRDEAEARRAHGKGVAP